ncbi:MAG: hypothetical protein ACYSUL_08420, partial [Planctomycetota bacterium]
MGCQLVLASLGKGLLSYSIDNNDKYPTADRWCDSYLEYLSKRGKSIEHYKKFLVCPSVKEEDLWFCSCSYAINPNCEPNSPDNVVLLFESSGVWNQYGCAELLNFDNHNGKGCNILFNNRSVKFITPEEVDELNWGSSVTPDQVLTEWKKNYAFLDSVEYVLTSRLVTAYSDFDPNFAQNDASLIKEHRIQKGKKFRFFLTI